MAVDSSGQTKGAAPIDTKAPPTPTTTTRSASPAPETPSTLNGSDGQTQAPEDEREVVRLFKGNIAYETKKVPENLEKRLFYKEDEMRSLRYTAATCDPDDLKKEGYELRQTLGAHPRKTELFIVITMYNEDEELFLDTMRSVMKNIAFICKNKSDTIMNGTEKWGDDAWKKIVVCIVSDGRAVANRRTLEALTVMGIYQEQILVTQWEDKSDLENETKKTAAHIFEYTTQLCLDENMAIEGPDSGLVPVQVIFCLKEQNQAKINSHRWFFNAFGPVLEPNVCLLLDVGTVPGPTSIFDLWSAFTDPQVAGACGEITVSTGERGRKLLNPLVAAQNFEYKTSNILDKPLESVFGFITVLPGAFSAYRYVALQEGPLDKYFMAERNKGQSSDIFTANMYLAEDRILCWELVSKPESDWVLRFVKSATGETDVPEQLPELILQRRRWLNGSFFAAVHALIHFPQIYRTNHTETRKLWIHIEVAYQAWTLFLSWFAMANYWIAFVILTTAMADFFPNGWIPLWNQLLRNVYQGLLLTSFLLAMGNRPIGTKYSYWGTLIGFAIIVGYMTFASYFFAVKGIRSVRAAHPHSSMIWLFFTNQLVFTVGVSLMSTIGSYVYASILLRDGWHMVTCFIQYILMAPAYINLFNVYAFANVHDVSWGTKQSDGPQDTKAATTKEKGDEHTTVTLPQATGTVEISKSYDDSAANLKRPRPKQKKGVKLEDETKDYQKLIRTNVLLAWALSNAVLAAGVTGTAHVSAAGDKVLQSYMTFILWSVAVLSLVRCIGATMFATTRFRFRMERAIEAFKAH